jgi:hypothetical protein
MFELFWKKKKKILRAVETWGMVCCRSWKQQHISKEEKKTIVNDDYE